MFVASSFAGVPVMVPEGREVKVPQGSEVGEPVGMYPLIAESLPVGGIELRSGADERSTDETWSDGATDGTVPLPDGVWEPDGALVLVWPCPGEEDGAVGTEPVDKPVPEPEELPGRGVDDPGTLVGLELGWPGGRELLAEGPEAALLDEPVPVEPGESGVELGCWPGVEIANGSPVDEPGGTTGTLDEGLEGTTGGTLRDVELEGTKGTLVDERGGTTCGTLEELEGMAGGTLGEELEDGISGVLDAALEGMTGGTLGVEVSVG